jgi:protein-tyrosine phosphatase
MDVIQLDKDGRLYISPDIDEWEPLKDHGINAIIDLDDDMDSGVPQTLNNVLYIYFPIEDRELPDLERLHSIALLGASLIVSGQRVISHCGMGHNRCALMAGLILVYLGMNGEDAIELIRSRRQGALYNKQFASYLASLRPDDLPVHPVVMPKPVAKLLEGV